jgi:phosphoserine phosphatase RsbU/P
MTAALATTHEFEKHILSSPIMIVDDNEINRIFLEKTLRARGFTKLLSVSSGEEALQKLSWFHTEMVILDIMMPNGMDGFECCEAIRAQNMYRDLPVLIQTTITDPELKVKAFAKGATDFVSKPIYPDELVARVMVHLEKRYSLETLQMYKKRVAIELESARQLQQYILPKMEDIADIERGCGLDIAAYYQPCSEVGGDFWTINSLFPNQTAFSLVDFSGHGVASALNAFRLQAYMKDHTSLTARPGEYLAHLNDKLLHLLMRGQFATMFYGIVDTQSNQLFYACACAPHPIIVRRNTKAAEMIDGSGVPLGIGLHLYHTQVAPFAAGDVLMLYSDALTETPNDKGEYLSEETIMKLLQQHHGAPANTLKDIVLEKFRAHAGATLNDDLTIVIVMRKAG